MYRYPLSISPPHPAIDEGQDQRADVGAVHIGVRHDNDLVVSHLGRIELIAFAGAYRSHHRPDFLMPQDFVRLLQHPLHIQNLAFQGQDCLEVPVPAHLRRTAGGLPLDDVQLRLRRIALGAVRQLPGKR